ncbi:MAG: DsbA family oxidoreductase [Oceanicoccus sp.]
MNLQPQPLPLRVDIVSDVVCPWCIIGFKQLSKALDSMPGMFNVEFHWHPFELNPAMPAEGQDLKEHLAEKYGSTQQKNSGVRERLITLGDSLGFKFDYSNGLRMVNTFSAHQLIYWAGEQGLQTELKLALFEAFFSNGDDVSNLEVLAAVASKVGLDQKQALDVVMDQRYAGHVRAEQQQWVEQDIYSVPVFFFNGKYSVPGAQDSETFIRYLGKIRDKERAA